MPETSKKTTALVLVHLNAYIPKLTRQVDIYHSIRLTEKDLNQVPELDAILEVPFGKFTLSLIIAEIRSHDGYRAIYSSQNSRVRIRHTNQEENHNIPLPQIWFRSGDGEILILPNV